MLLSTLEDMQVNELDSVAPILQARTAIEDWSGHKTEVEPVYVRYPNKRKTRQHNERQTIAGKSNITQIVYHKLSHSPLSDRRKTQAREYVRNLRPSMATLKAHYRNKGDSKAVVDLLVTPENYPNLPMVWITKKQQKFLLDIIDGREDKNFIANGFH